MTERWKHPLARSRGGRRLSAADAEQWLDGPVLGRLPWSADLARLTRFDALPPADYEACRRLRMNLRYRDEERDLITVAVTGASIGDGASTTAWHLAAASAHARISTLLVEADLHGGLARRVPPPRRGTLDEFLEEVQGGVPAQPPPSAAQGDPVGMTDVLGREASLEWAAVPVHVGVDGTSRDRQAHIDVLYAGTRRGCPELVSGGRLAELLAQAEQRYELVVVDTPPAGAAADAVPVLASVAGVVVVTRPGHTRASALARAREQLQLIRAPVLGAVVNGLSARAALEEAPPERGRSRLIRSVRSPRYPLPWRSRW